MTASGKLYQKLQMMSHSTENDLIQRMFLEMEPESYKRYVRIC